MLTIRSYSEFMMIIIVTYDDNDHEYDDDDVDDNQVPVEQVHGGVHERATQV